MSEKKTIYILWKEKTYPVSWFEGSSDASIERAIHCVLGTQEGPLPLVDEQNETVAISDKMPNGIHLRYRPETAVTFVTPPAPDPLPELQYTLGGTDSYDYTFNLCRLLQQHGSFIRFQEEDSQYVCSDADLLQEILERPKEFQKEITPQSVLGNLQEHTTGHGLFTASDRDPLWQKASRILLPGFGVQGIEKYYEGMLDVANELLNHLDQISEKQSILLTDWMTRMTFEAIGRAGFSTAFHCMGQKDLPPFVRAMAISMSAVAIEGRQSPPEIFNAADRQKRKEADRLLRDFVDKIILERKEKIARGEKCPEDLLQIMLLKSDPVTGEKLPDENIRDQLIVFLIAGHETTSGLLSFAIYYLITNPEIERRLIEEVDRVLGRDFSYKPSFQDINRLTYTLQVLEETLRLQPPAPGFTKTAMQDAVLGNKYQIKKGEVILFVLHALHRDPKHWSDPERFDPDRFTPAESRKRHPNCYHPFGAGMRSCIGFRFSLIEATMVLARLYQRFRFHLVDSNYQLRYEDTLTIKPRALQLTLEKREEKKGQFPEKEQETANCCVTGPVLSEVQEGAPTFLLLYGSNLGTCQEAVCLMAQHAQAKGYRPIIRSLNEQVQKPWTSNLVGIVTSTYNGTPPDNAAAFDSWIRSLEGTPFSQIHFTVLGVGKRQWLSTFLKFPSFVFKRMQELGAQPFYPMGGADVGRDPDGTIEEWSVGAWEALSKLLPPASARGEEKLATLTYTCEIVNFAGAITHNISQTPLAAQAKLMELTTNRELLRSVLDRSTRHIEFRLPEGSSYTAGDHFGVVPENPPEVVQEIAKLFRLRLEDLVVIKSLQETREAEKLLIGTPVAISDILTYYLDLLGPVSRKELRLLAELCPCPPEKKMLQELASEKFISEIVNQEVTFHQICERFRSLPLSLELLLTARPPLKVRYYSISSSPLMLSGACSITVGVQEHKTMTGRTHKGLCSHYLAKTPEKSEIFCFVKDTKSNFRLPDNPGQDLILIGPGTGVAPLRGFLQERRKQREEGIKIGRQLLFFGCHNPDQDYIYREEFEDDFQTGLLQGLYVAFSRIPGQPKQYVQDLLRKESDRVWEFIQNGARVLLCGDGKNMAPAVRGTFVELFEKRGGYSKKHAEDFLQELQAKNLYIEDVWG